MLKAARVDPVEPRDAQRALQEDLHLPHTTPQPSSAIASPARLRLLAAAREKERESVRKSQVGGSDRHGKEAVASGLSRGFFVVVGGGLGGLVRT